ncbi:hypothetical protein D5S17_10430 [Pseudonocardiaceae bacterium YIM PH 21723]|nr:hypothetical protein D5S17_10430 [Pseudonocardiaceae bacterium YIM PH 21723]
MGYLINLDDLSSVQLEALPIRTLQSVAEVFTMLELTPENGRPINDENPECAVLQVIFGEHSEGIISYLLLPDQQRVDIVHILWLG